MVLDKNLDPSTIIGEGYGSHLIRALKQSTNCYRPTTRASPRFSSLVAGRIVEMTRIATAPPQQHSSDS
jgi:hypothetical protein